MSWADEASIKELATTGYWAEIDEEMEDSRFHTLKNGTEICDTCGSKNIKVSKAGNKYCGDLCWVDNTAEDEACGMGFQDWRNDNDH